MRGESRSGSKAIFLPWLHAADQRSYTSFTRLLALIAFVTVMWVLGNYKEARVRNEMNHL